MNNLKHWEKKASGWVFLSHASEDYEFVKTIRNYLEDNGFSALMFYLKSLESSGSDRMIEKLIFDEIEARNIFVLCESEYAKKSKWVKKEVREVKTYSDKIFRKIDMNLLKHKKATALSVLDDLLNFASLYFINHSNDQEKIDRIYTSLNLKGFRIFKNNPNETSRHQDKDFQFNSAMEDASKEGTILIFLSKSIVKSQWFWDEKALALKNHKSDSIIPIVLDDLDITEVPAFRNRKDFITVSNYNIRWYSKVFEESESNMQEYNAFINEIFLRINQVRSSKNENSWGFEKTNEVNLDYLT